MAVEHCEKEIELWRRDFLTKNNISPTTHPFAHGVFLSTPSEEFIKKSPEQNLIQCLAAKHKEIR